MQATLLGPADTVAEKMAAAFGLPVAFKARTLCVMDGMHCIASKVKLLVLITQWLSQ